MQEDITVSDGAITGTLKYIEGGLSPSGPLSGSGYFLALKWSDPDESATSLKVGLIPSASGMDLVECIDDTDRDGVFKITNIEKQKFVIVESATGKSRTQQYKLNGLTLESTGV
jgi:hypothetical protein